MGNITIICSVSAEFPSPNKGEKPFVIGRKDLNLIMSAPEWIEKTAMFRMLAADGSLKAVTSANRVQAENNPTVGLGADGKAIKEQPVQEKPKAKRNTKVKKEPKEEPVEEKVDAE